MKVHLFASTSSPGVANFALKKIANDYEHVSRRASRFLIKSFYVDDGLKSKHTVEEAQETLQETKKLCAARNLNVHKIASNSETVLDSVPPEERASKQYSIGASERALGIQWSTTNDTFKFQIDLKSFPATRRGILATTASVFDPIGLLSPLILKGRFITQALCKENLG